MKIPSLAYWTLGGIAAVEALSFFSFLDSRQAGAWAFGIVVVAAIALTIRKLEYGVMLVFGELVIGSFGRMLELSINGFDVSIRMALWLIVIIAWLGRAIQKRRIEFYHSPLFKPYLALAAVLGWGIAWGFIRGNPVGLVFSDVNNYLYFALIFPVYDIFVLGRDAMYRVFTVLMAAFGWLSIKTIVLFYIFSHEFFGLQDVLYDWSRHSHLAEITNIDPTIILSRVFMQSQIWLVFGAFFLLGVLYMSLRGALYSGRRGNPNVASDAINQKTESSGLLGLPRSPAEEAGSLAMTIGLLILSLAAIIASFSRSFWLAMAIAFIIFVIALFAIMRERVAVVGRFMAIAAGTGVLAVGLVILAMRFPIPPSSADPGLIAHRAGKFTGEAAVSSRYAQIRPLLESIKNYPVWGSGFGASVTYQSLDPRVLKNNPDGWYTTTAFELGWLEMWLKIGLLGVGAYLYLLWRIIKSGWNKIKHHAEPVSTSCVLESKYLVLGAMAGLVAVALTHGVSPYLNHPLGIGSIILITALVSWEKNRA